MKLLFDQNLSRKLVARLVELFPNSSHVQFHSLTATEDSEIWGFAKAQDFCIVTHQRFIDNPALDCLELY